MNVKINNNAKLIKLTSQQTTHVKIFVKFHMFTVKKTNHVIYVLKHNLYQ